MSQSPRTALELSSISQPKRAFVPPTSNRDQPIRVSWVYGSNSTSWQSRCISDVEVIVDTRHQNNDKDREEPKEPHTPGAGITNRPDDEERDNQDRLPPRGQSKAGD